jgi:N4-bis(aminopropyl)spermidine synthase
MSDDSDLLEELALATRLHEGPEGIRKILRSIFRQGPVPIRDLARDLGIPVPVVAAVRGELEKRGLASRESGVQLTEQGIEVLKTSSGIASKTRYEVTSVLDLPESLLGLVSRFAEIADARPDADFSLDQSHATAETAIRRAIYLYENDAIEGRSVICLGDDDLTSIAIGLVSEHLKVRPKRLTVLDVDDRLVEFIGDTGGVPVEAIQHDLRQPIPDGFSGKFDVFFTDPPYTIPGLKLFAERGVRALAPQVGKMGFVSFGRKSPGEAVGIGRTLSELDLALIEVIPDFNRYDGAQLLAGSSQMIRVVSGGGANPNAEEYAGPLYTRDVRRQPRG